MEGCLRCQDWHRMGLGDCPSCDMVNNEREYMKDIFKVIETKSGAYAVQNTQTFVVVCISSTRRGAQDNADRLNGKYKVYSKYAENFGQ